MTDERNPKQIRRHGDRLDDVEKDGNTRLVRLAAKVTFLSCLRLARTKINSDQETPSISNSRAASRSSPTLTGDGAVRVDRQSNRVAVATGRANEKEKKNETKQEAVGK